MADIIASISAFLTDLGTVKTSMTAIFAALVALALLALIFSRFGK